MFSINKLLSPFQKQPYSNYHNPDAKYSKRIWTPHFLDNKSQKSLYAYRTFCIVPIALTFCSEKAINFLRLPYAKTKTYFHNKKVKEVNSKIIENRNDLFKKVAICSGLIIFIVVVAKSYKILKRFSSVNIPKEIETPEILPLNSESFHAPVNTHPKIEIPKIKHSPYKNSQIKDYIIFFGIISVVGILMCGYRKRKNPIIQEVTTTPDDSTSNHELDKPKKPHVIRNNFEKYLPAFKFFKLKEENKLNSSTSMTSTHEQQNNEQSKKQKTKLN